MKKFLVFVLSLFISANIATCATLPVSATSFQECGTNVCDCDVILTEQENQAILSLASNCGLSYKELKSMLCFEAKGKSCFLVPVCDCEEHKQCLLNLFSYADPDYMKYYKYFPMSPEQVNELFSRALIKLNQLSPTSITFFVKTQDKVVARIGLGPLNSYKNADSDDAEIGYAIEESYSGQGIMTKAVDTTLKFLRYLRTCGNSGYDFEKLRATAMLNNKASNAILSKCGFIRMEIPVDEGRRNEYFYYF